MALRSSPQKRFVEEADGEEYLHKLVWLLVDRQRDYASSKAPGYGLDNLAAMLFAAHALEGYLNFVGERIDKDLWLRERQEFAETGTLGKLAHLRKRTGLPALDKGRRPISTLLKLKQLRDQIAHPKIYKVKTRKVWVEGKEPPLFEPPFVHKFADEKITARTIEDVKGVITELHLAAMAAFPDANLGPHPLGGSFSARTSRSTLLLNGEPR